MLRVRLGGDLGTFYSAGLVVRRDLAGHQESRRELPWRAIKLQKELIRQCLSEDEARLVRDHALHLIGQHVVPALR